MIQDYFVLQISEENGEWQSIIVKAQTQHIKETIEKAFLSLSI